MQLELFEVVKREDDAFLIFQVENRIFEMHHFLLMRELFLDHGLFAAGQQFGRRGHVAFAFAGRSIEGNVMGTFHVGLPAPQRVHVDIQLCGEFAVVWCPPMLAHPCLSRRADLARLAANRSRHVVLLAQFIENRPAYAGRREGAERETARGIEAFEGSHEAHGPRAHQLVEIDAHRECA